MPFFTWLVSILVDRFLVAFINWFSSWVSSLKRVATRKKTIEEVIDEIKKAETPDDFDQAARDLARHGDG